MPFWVKTVLLGQEVHYYMVYIAYFTELNSKNWDYAQKRRICRENCKYALDERFHGHFCPCRKHAKSCHPGSKRQKNRNIDQWWSSKWQYCSYTIYMHCCSTHAREPELRISWIGICFLTLGKFSKLNLIVTQIEQSLRSFLSKELNKSCRPQSERPVQSHHCWWD